MRFANDLWRDLNGKREPYRLRICLKPDAHGDAYPDPGSHDFPVIFEERPLARLSADRALRAVAGRAKGTVGGAVRSARGDVLGVTCSHVVSNSPTLEIGDEATSLVRRIVALATGQATFSAECVKRTQLVQLGEGTPCNPYGVTDASNVLDLALIAGDFSKLDLTIAEGPPAPRASASSGQAVKMLATEGTRVAQIGGLAIYYVLRDDTGAYCFRDLFEVLASPYTPKVVSVGDSGAWIMRYGPDRDEWLGMVLGSDDLRGFAMFAETAPAWAEREGIKLA
jgi:hypothetical protein